MDYSSSGQSGQQPDPGTGSPGQYDSYGGQTGYNPPPPPKPKKGFNWLACCGISCLILLIVGGALAYGCYTMVKPLAEMGMAMVEVSEKVTATDLATIKDSAVAVTAVELSAKADSYKDQWLMLEGVVQSVDSSGTYSSQAGSTDATAYILENTIIVMDVTNAPHVARAGETIRVYGQSYAWSFDSMTSIPFIGDMMKEAMKEEPEFKNMQGMVFFFTKEVSVVGGSTPGEGTSDGAPSENLSDRPPREADGQDQGWIR